jgi:hypothetical protein
MVDLFSKNKTTNKKGKDKQTTHIQAYNAYISLFSYSQIQWYREK